LPALVDDQGETKNHQRALAIRRLWEIDTLRTHYVFVSSGRSLDDSIRVRAEDWKKYLFDNVTIKSEDRAGNQTVKFVVNLDLSGFCKGAEPLYDLTTH
jgi:hypothetical protein